ncbi:lysozyme C-2-like [Scyliorhinus canicula]|uniref:lysozyme C-2-like n=1 Tax=Scyliorhinus canicula TaxID=7830 RepID=UPI0018F41C57|nr:lysozyme C-2-like [Scyliorhinus canicula]
MDFTDNSLANWVCMVDLESGFNTKITRHYRNRGIITSTNYGIFQINNKVWCDDGTASFKYNLCDLKCNSLLDDDITDDIQCVKSTVITQLGMDIWFRTFERGTEATAQQDPRKGREHKRRDREDEEHYNCYF